MKKLMALLLIVALALPLSMGLFATAAEEVVLPKHKTGRVLFDGTIEALDNAPLSIKGVTYLPVKELAAKAGVTTELKLDGVQTFGEVDYAPVKTLAAAVGYYYYENKTNDLIWLFTDKSASKDGVYNVWASADSRGYAANVAVTIKDGKISAVKYDELNLNTGELKYADGKYTANWKTRYPDVDPDALLAQSIAQLVEKQAPTKVDFTTGATRTYKNVTELTSLALAKAKHAQLNPAKVGGYRDGKFEVVGLTDSRGYTPVLKMTVAAGRITWVEYNEFGPNGMVKRNNPDYIGRWATTYGVDPMKMLVEREAQLISMQDPNMVDAMTGATSWYTNFTQLAATALDHASRTEAVEFTANDGLYYVKGAADSRGYTPLLMATIKDGKIETVKYHEINRSFLSKRNDAAYIGRWTTAYPQVKPLETLAAMEAAVVENNSFDAIDAITGATSWKQNIMTLGKDIMVQAAKETTYLFRASSTANSCYYASMLVEADANKEITFMSYKEYQNGASPLPKIDNPAYLNNWKNNARIVEQFPNIDQKFAYQLMMDKLMETRNPDALDTITSASNWRKGIKEAGAKAFEWIK